MAAQPSWPCWAARIHMAVTRIACGETKAGLAEGGCARRGSALLGLLLPGPEGCPLHSDSVHGLDQNRAVLHAPLRDSCQRAALAKEIYLQISLALTAPFRRRNPSGCSSPGGESGINHLLQRQSPRVGLVEPCNVAFHSGPFVLGSCMWPARGTWPARGCAEAVSCIGQPGESPWQRARMQFATGPLQMFPRVHSGRNSLWTESKPSGTAPLEGPGGDPGETDCFSGNSGAAVHLQRAFRLLSVP